MLVVSFLVTLTASAVSAITIPGEHRNNGEGDDNGNGNIMSWMNPSGVTQDHAYMHNGMAKQYFDNGGNFDALPGEKTGWVYPGGPTPEES